MGSILLMAGSIAVFALAYRYYGRYVSERVFMADPGNSVPSEVLEDGVDHVPTVKGVLFGHHFSSIAGTGPIVGPAIAVIWGWVPAILWIVLGSVFAGAVHDYASLMISVREGGVSIGELSERVISPRVRVLFQIVVLFALWIVVAIFGMVMAVIFSMYPQSVIPVWLQLPIALLIGHLAYRKGFSMLPMSVIGVCLLYASMVLGVRFPFVMPPVAGMTPMAVWIILLLVYAFIASVLPVWALLQPRDYINSHQLLAGLGLITCGVVFAAPRIVAPAVRLAPEGAPPILPFIFITIACGAISGFHSLISSGTSSKQLKNERDARMIGFGSMLTEAFLAVVVVISVAAGIGMMVSTASGEVLSGVAAWEHHYGSWASAGGLANQLAAFVNGAANMMGSLGIPLRYGQAIAGVLIASFAGTTLDTATRIQRYVITEFARKKFRRRRSDRFVASALAVIAAAALAFAQGGGRGALMLWPLFGSSNQLLAGLVLMVATVYLIKRRAPFLCCAVPMVFMVVSSSWALMVNIRDLLISGRSALAVIGFAILALQGWMIFEAYRYVRIGRDRFFARP